MHPLFCVISGCLPSPSRATYPQLEQTIKQLEAQLARVRDELTVGVPAVLAENGQVSADYLKNSLNKFLTSAETKLKLLLETLTRVTEAIKKTMAL